MKDSIDNTAIALDKGKKARKKARDLTVEDFYFLKIGNMWRYMKTQHFSFWMICCYIFFEYTRPQAIFPSIDILPWAQSFILLSLVGAVLDPSVRWVKHPVNLMMHAFALWILLSSIYAFDPEISKKHYIDFYSWYVIYFLIITIVNTRERFYVFIMVILISMAKIAIGTAKQWILRGFSFTGWGLMGPAGYFQNSGELAILMLMLFPLAYYLYEYLKDDVSRWERWLLVAFWVAPILTILGASSRGAQVALAFQLLFMFYKQIFRVKSLIFISVLLASLYYLLPEEQKARFSEAGEDKTSVQRLLYWEHGVEMIKEYPWLGVGFFNFPTYYGQYFSSDLLYPKAQLPHNIFIQVGTDGGIPALLIYIIILFAGIFAFWRYRLVNKDYGAILQGLSFGMIGFGLAGQFVSVAYYPFIWVGSSLVVACVSIIRKKALMLNPRGTKSE